VVLGSGVRMKGGWSRVVGKVGVEEACGLRSPISEIVANRELWSLWYVFSVVVAVVVVGGGRGASFGMRMSQFYSGEFVGMNVGMRGSPTCVSDVSVGKSVRGL
jgi:asparagine N-glycosylation enzyme membrane subunit Stt3